VTPFEHRSVLISIVLGLGMAHLLWSVHRIVQTRDRLKLYWLTILWVAVIFVAQVEWWANYSLQNQVTDWTFFYFLFVLASPATLDPAAAFVSPDVEQGQQYDLREYALLVGSRASAATRCTTPSSPWPSAGSSSSSSSPKHSNWRKPQQFLAEMQRPQRERSTARVPSCNTRRNLTICN
jgi:hypothetical protein